MLYREQKEGVVGGSAPIFLQLYSTSAGSGKTYCLVQHYLFHSLGGGGSSFHKDAFRRVIALTFTNKTAEEMRARILRRFDEVHKGGDDELARILGIDSGELSHRAGEVLQRILHYYSYFHVSTLDVFFLRLLSSFFLELGWYGGFETELDTAPAFAKITEDLFQQIGQKDTDEVEGWLMRFFREHIGDGKSFASFERGLLGMDKLLFHSFSKKKQREELSLSQVKALYHRSGDIKADYERSLDTFCRSAYAHIASCGLKKDDFRKKGGVYKLLEKITGGDYTIARNLEKHEGSDVFTWVVANASEEVKEKLVGCLNGGLLRDYESIKGKAKKDGVGYATASLVHKHLHKWGLMGYYQDKMRLYREEKRLFFLSDVPDVLSDAVREDTALYFYEKIGIFLDHYLIDEFQDISIPQWRVLSRLIHEGTSQGRKHMLVGDAKQSIYRWRDANTLGLLHDLGDFPGGYEKKLLAHNWRSAKEVIAFNNRFFSQLFDFSKRYIEENFGGYTKALEMLWEGLEQAFTADSKEGGYVNVRPFASREEGMDALYEDIQDALGRGYEWADIYVLVRNNNEVREVVEALSARFEGKGRVVSDEAFLLRNNLSVEHLIISLQHVCYPNEPLYCQQLEHIACVEGLLFFSLRRSDFL